jgi:hypothetical protein
MFEYKNVDELVRITASGGGFSLNAGPYEVGDLVRIASAAGGGNYRARLKLYNVNHLSTDELVRISAAGQGSVEFIEKD